MRPESISAPFLTTSATDSVSLPTKTATYSPANGKTITLRNKLTFDRGKQLILDVFLYQLKNFVSFCQFFRYSVVIYVETNFIFCDSGASINGVMMLMSKNAIQTVFSEHEKFIVIGLTGRTGSGCTTLSKILQTEDFADLALRKPKESDFKYNYERKERIIYNYAKEHWKHGFTDISMTDVISSFVFEDGTEEVLNYLKGLESKGISPETVEKIVAVFEKLSEEIDQLSTNIKACFNAQERDEKLGKNTKDLLKNINSTTEKIKDGLKYINLTYTDKENDNASAYTHLYQCFGNNVRSSGNAFSDEFTGDHFFALSKRTNDIIKNLRCIQGQSAFFVIDAIRNPYEAQFFRDRYAAFYLISVNTDEDERISRLSYMTREQIENLDRVDYPSDLKDNKQFSNQDTATCIQMADIHISNPFCDTPKNYFLTQQIVRYVMLMMHPGLVSPTHVERCMQLAYTAKVNSGCISRQVGAVITDEDFSVKAVGWNDVPKGQVPCSLRDVCSFCQEMDKSSHSYYELTNKKFIKYMGERNKASANKLNGRLYPYCFKSIYNEIEANKNQVHTRALHAEENAFLQLAKYSSGGIKNGYLFTSASPCELCSKKAYQLGIKRIYYIDPYPGISQQHILKFGTGEHDPEMHLFYGAIGKAYINLYMQYIPIKDELTSLLSN